MNSFLPYYRDLLHPNTVAIFDGSQAHRSEIFKKGNVLISLRNISTIAIIDPEKREIVWALANAWKYQHEPVLLENGHILVFDNHAAHLTSTSAEERSRIVEFDPLTQQIYWEYPGDKTTPFFSSLQGSNQRLPNGNTLITESDYGRVIEVTPEKEIVWEFNNPHTAGDNNEFVAVIPEMIRISPDFPIENFVKPQSD
jgi:hypothetical protein